MTKSAKAEFDARFAAEMSETVGDMYALGLLDDVACKVTMRDLNRAPQIETLLPLTGSEIRDLREKAHVSQAVFARYLNLTVDHISKLERGVKRPTGPALVLLNVIRRKGISAIL